MARRIADCSGMSGGGSVESTANRDYAQACQRKADELAGLIRIAKELRKISSRERASFQPLQENTERVIARSRQLIAKSTALAVQGETVRQTVAVFAQSAQPEAELH
ncbi:MAG: hypothetical protein AB8B85_11835 [Paracoccaceae bacterium]